MVDTKYSPINCADYDYLEIACMDQYDVEILSQGETFHGIAENLEVVTGEEFLVLNISDSSQVTIRIDLIDHLRVTSRPCRFQEHAFGRDVISP